MGAEEKILLQILHELRKLTTELQEDRQARNETSRKLEILTRHAARQEFQLTQELEDQIKDCAEKVIEYARRTGFV